jgi:aldose 1-epimerase
MKLRVYILLFGITTIFFQCTINNNKLERIKSEPFGKAPDGTPVELFTLKNLNGVTAQITNYGGIITALNVPDKDGNFEDVVLGFYTLEEYIKKSPHFGCLVGRYGNRIAEGKFTLDGVEYQMAVNNGPNHLHGGVVGFDKKVWTPEMLTEENGSALKLTYLSPDGEENYPGNLNVEAVYRLNDDNELILTFIATTDKKTVLNLTHHSYFNLKGHGNGDILDHEIQFNSAEFVAIDSTSIPLGPLMNVSNTPFNFLQPKPIGQDIEAEDEQIRNGGGYDHSFVVDGYNEELKLACTVRERTSGRIMEVWTTEPAVQFYTGNFLDGSIKGKDGKVYNKRYGFCLEAQHYPDSPNHPEYPTTVLDPGEVYDQTTIYKFLTE